MSNYKPEVLVQGAWAQNALVFATEAEALAWAKGLMRRWLLATAARAVPTDDKVNHRLVDGEIQPVKAES